MGISSCYLFLVFVIMAGKFSDFFWYMPVKTVCRILPGS